MTDHPFTIIERTIVDYFETVGGDVMEDGAEWFLSLYDEGPALSLTGLAGAIAAALAPHDAKGGAA